MSDDLTPLFLKVLVYSGKITTADPGFKRDRFKTRGTGRGTRTQHLPRARPSSTILSYPSVLGGSVKFKWCMVKARREDQFYWPLPPGSQLASPGLKRYPDDPLIVQSRLLTHNLPYTYGNVCFESSFNKNSLMFEIIYYIRYTRGCSGYVFDCFSS